VARPTLNGHPKFAHLSGLVGGRGPARGYLELIWDAAYACGEPVIGDSRKVEAVADWRGPRGELAAALVESGFLDVVQADANGKQLQTFAVHDLEHHAPDYVLKRWHREAERKAKGETVRSIRQRAAASRWKQTDANGEHEHANVRPHAPAPAPAQFSPPACDPCAAEQVAVAREAIREAAAAAMAEDDDSERPETPPPGLWSADEWRRRFGAAWSRDNANMPYGRGAGDAKAVGTLAGMLEDLGLEGRADAQAASGRMFAEFLGDRSPKAVAERHQFSLFVLNFNGLRAPRKQAEARAIGPPSGQSGPQYKTLTPRKLGPNP